jgi:hypothetical protein
MKLACLIDNLSPGCYNAGKVGKFAPRNRDKRSSCDVGSTAGQRFWETRAGVQWGGPTKGPE